MAQQNRVTPSPFDLGLKTLDLDLDLDCDNMAAELLLVGGVERVAALKACCHSEGSCGWKRMDQSVNESSTISCSLSVFNFPLLIRHNIIYDAGHSTELLQSFRY